MIRRLSGTHMAAGNASDDILDLLFAFPLEVVGSARDGIIGKGRCKYI